MALRNLINDILFLRTNNRVLEMASDFPNTGNVAVCAPTSMGHKPGKYPWVFYTKFIYTTLAYIV